MKTQSLILSTASRYLLPLLLLFSIFLLLRGHNEPGGGFVGGLVAAAAFALHAIAFDVPSTRYLLRVEPLVLIGTGLLMAAASGLFGLLVGEPFMTALWSTRELPVLGKLGTPLLFDLGVYLVVLGITLKIVFVLAEE
ncbi:MAG: Na+/H+ antiporter subunit B [Anaerolineales bacterium]|nr:Na+/H+ antiporter subunit B [Anaerolineales bacterium]